MELSETKANQNSNIHLRHANIVLLIQGVHEFLHKFIELVKQIKFNFEEKVLFP